MKFGRYTYGVENITELNYGSTSTLTIGSFCSISENIIVFLGGNHRTDRVSTYPFGHIFFSVFDTFNGSGHPVSNGDVVIGNDVWLGFNVTIMSGVTIGDGAVVSCNSHVVDDVSPYTVVGGNPAKLIRKRFTDIQIQNLLNIAWWDWPEEKINKFLPSICNSDIDSFIGAAS
jgi:acetyltransferase-like isoleucine patch superfamily enzyme